MLVHRQSGTVLYFHQAISEKKIIAIPGIHDFDAHRLDALLLNAPELQLHPRAEPEGVGDAVDDPSSDEELSTTDGDTSDDDDSVDPKWCPPNPNAQDDPTGRTDWCCRKAGHHDDGQGAAPLQHLFHT